MKRAATWTRTRRLAWRMAGLAAGLMTWALLPGSAVAHCDRLDGPVVASARLALKQGDVTPALRWVRKEDEPQLRAAFRKTLVVRKGGPQATELADMYFFETLVRLHRAGEGAPYTGLKPAGEPLEPAIAAVDAAIESGSVESLIDTVTAEVAAGIRHRHETVLRRKEAADRSVGAGRAYVAAYVEFLHYVERIHLDAAGSGGHGAAPAVEGDPHRHE